jgi:anaerobic magnesium-protoporphyrin IX monomethyl ester cyclase
MKRILLVPSPQVVGQEIEPFLPLGLFSLQAIGTQFGDPVDVLDPWSETRGRSFSDSRELAEAILRHVDLSQYDVVGLSSACSTLHHSLMIASRIKEKAPHVSVWMGGPHASALSEDVLQASSDVDAVFVGESEATFSEVLARRSRGVTDLTGVAGLHTREGGYSPRPPLNDLDRLPFIDNTRGFLAASRNAKPYHFDNAVPFEATRGCTGRCAFCSAYRFWGGRVRRKSEARLIAEMRRFYSAVGISYFNFIGDNFAAPRQRLLEFCRAMTEDAGAFRWVCNLRMDRIRPTDLDTLWAGGCRGFFVGVESASQRTLDRIGKGINLERELEVIRRAVEMGFLVETSFIIGFPWETKGDLDRTFDLHCQLLRCGVFRSSVWILCPLPGTRFGEDSCYQVRSDRGRSGVAGDDLPLDDAATELIKEHPRLFRHFGHCETDHLGWVDLIAVADASAHLMGAYAKKWE